MKKMILIGCTALMAGGMLVGCQSENPPQPKEFVNLPVYTAAQGIPADSQEKYMSNPALRAYAIGRYIDPATGTVMHEEHSVYRLVRTPEWNLIPQPDAEPLRTVEQNRQERYADILEGQVNRTVADMEIARKEIADLLAAQRDGSTSVEVLQSQLDELNRKYATLVDNLMKLATYVNELESRILRPGGNRSAIESD